MEVSPDLRRERALLTRATRLGLALVSASPIGLTNDFCGYITTEVVFPTHKTSR